MSELAALMKAVYASPADDLPRLVLADWLDEHGDPTHARMIRFQCAAYPTHTEDCGVMDWSSRCAACHIDGQVSTLLLFGADHQGGGLRDRWEPLFSPHVPGIFSREPPADWQPERNSNGGRGCDVWATVRRGFVHTVHCNLAAWVGGECGRCGGVGLERFHTSGYDYEESDCPDCSGVAKGESGIGSAVVAGHPVERVVVTDREPMCYYDGADWFWVPAEVGYPLPDDTRHHLPREVWDSLEGFDLTPTARVRARRYPTADAARLALSAALTAWARSSPSK